MVLPINMQEDKPTTVTIVMPVRNEEKFIENCLRSILENDYSKEKLEILIVDGNSTDRTKEIIQNISTKFPFIRILDTTARVHGEAMNIGIQQARGDIIIRMDAHTLYASDYITQCVHLLLTTAAANVGGVQFAVGHNFITQSIALATMSRFGAGNAHFRYSKKEQWVDTVYLGAWKKETLEKLGGFNSRWSVNEDYEINYRLREMGGKILLSPKIQCKYYVRSTIYRLMRQYFRYGYGKVRTILKHPKSTKIRQIIPPIFVLAMILSIVFAFQGYYWGIFLPIFYILMNLYFSVRITSQHGLKYLCSLPFIFTLIHFSWGLGFWIGLPKFLFGKD
jgi:succinoglycan biosynthesis protein ExoA